jgi:hypothetical protein
MRSLPAEWNKKCKKVLMIGKIRTWTTVAGLVALVGGSMVILTGITIGLRCWHPFETTEQRVHRLLHEMAYQPSDLDFGWSGRYYELPHADLKAMGERAVPCLMECLKDPDWLMRRQAARCLEDFGDRRAVCSLIATLSDPEGEVCVAAMKALVSISPDQAAKPIIGVLQHPEWYARWTAVGILGALGDRRAIEPLRGVCRNKDEVDSTRSHAAEMVRRLTSSAAAPQPK